MFGSAVSITLGILMWLLNTTTYELQSFVPEKTPPYAILSHCWSEGEVSFADIQDLSVARQRPGWTKVEKACWSAWHTHGYTWIWDDTCCIDKSSSAELSEAINSMYSWYQRAGICIAYLHDVQEHRNGSSSSFRKSIWFTRGWTLQELVAPRNLIFLGENWGELGYREDFASVLEKITRIDAKLLKRSELSTAIHRASLAERMSWAAGRQTTRPEDRAYSLMGVFNVNMPTIYGEGGPGAFRRLQLEIIQKSTDHSLFAWGPCRQKADSGSLLRPDVPIYTGDGYNPLSPLASSPDDFHMTSNLRRMRLSDMTSWLGVGPIRELHYTSTNAGIRIQLPLRRMSSESAMEEVYCAALSCRTVVEEGPRRGQTESIVGLLLVKVGVDEYVCAESRESTAVYHEVGPMTVSDVLTRRVAIIYESPVAASGERRAGRWWKVGRWRIPRKAGGQPWVVRMIYIRTPS